MSVQDHTVDGVTYYSAIAVDGWPTGPCPSVEKCLDRLHAYERGDEVSEAAPQQCSRAQMTAFHAWVETEPDTSAVVDAAFAAGLHSEDWCRASARFVARIRQLPDYVARAGGARIRRAPGEVSLARGGRS